MTWRIDKQTGVAYPDPNEFKGPRIELPLRPMLGCVATAPANKTAIPTTFQDNFGGNVDFCLARGWSMRSRTWWILSPQSWRKCANDT